MEIRLIHGSSATVPYNETALQNLFVQSYKKAGIESRIKVHLARHILGYQQEKMGCVLCTGTLLVFIYKTVVSQLNRPRSWGGREIPIRTRMRLPCQKRFVDDSFRLQSTTGSDNQFQLLKAILGAHGYKLHETYDLMRRRGGTWCYCHMRIREATRTFLSTCGRGGNIYWHPSAGIYYHYYSAAVFSSTGTECQGPQGHYDGPPYCLAFHCSYSFLDGLFN